VDDWLGNRIYTQIRNLDGDSLLRCLVRAHTNACTTKGENRLRPVYTSKRRQRTRIA